MSAKHLLLVKTSLTLTEDQLEELNIICTDYIKSALTAQGRTGVKAGDHDDYELKSWIWWRHMAEKAYEGDMAPRIPTADVFSLSNLSDNMPQMHIEQHSVEIANLLLKENRMFGWEAEGDEDKDPGIDAARRRLKFRARRINLARVLRQAVGNAIKLGEQIIKPSFRTVMKMNPVTGRIVMAGDGKPLVDSLGSYVTEHDEWLEDPAEQGQKFLARDPRFALPLDADPQLSSKPFSFNQPTVLQAGARFDCVHYADFICDPKFYTIRDAEVKGQRFMATPEKMIAMLFFGRRDEKKIKEYKEKYTGLGSTTVTGSRAAREEQGENVDFGRSDENKEKSASESSTRERLYEELWVTADLNRDGIDENYLVVRDVDEEIIVGAAHAREIMSWHEDEDATDPFINLRAIEVPDRWYGIGYYKLMFDDWTQYDRMLNRVELETKHAGNALFGERNATQRGKQGLPILIRTNEINETTKGADPNEALVIKTIQPQIAEMLDAMDRKAQRIQSRHGLITPGQAESTGLEAANTATGMTILENKGNMHVDARINTISQGMEDALMSFAMIELGDGFDPADAVKQLGETDYGALSEWLEEASGNLMDKVRIMLAHMRSTNDVSRLQNIVSILDKFHTLPIERQISEKDLYVNMLVDLDVTSPEKYLRNKAEAQVEFLTYVNNFAMANGMTPEDVMAMVMQSQITQNEQGQPTA